MKLLDRISFRHWVSDWRTHVKLLDIAAGAEAAAGSEEVAHKKGDHIAIVSRWGGVEYDVLSVTVFDPLLDGGRKLAQVTSRDFDNKVNLYSHRTRDTGLPRAITNKGRPRYLMEQGPDALRWGAAVEGMSVDALVMAAIEGCVGLGRLPRIRQAEKPLEALKALSVTIKERSIAVKREMAALEEELRALDWELEKLRAI